MKTCTRCLRVCAQCEHLQRTNPLTCGVDKQRVVDHARINQCPKGYYDEGAVEIAQSPKLIEPKVSTLTIIPGWMAEREKQCKACPHLIANRPPGELYCGLLMTSRKAGLIYHPKGIPNPDAQCPDKPPRWLRMPRQSGENPVSYGCRSSKAQTGLSSAPSATIGRKAP